MIAVIVLTENMGAQDSTDKLVDNLVNKFLGINFRVSSVLLANLDTTTSGKCEHLRADLHNTTVGMSPCSDKDSSRSSSISTSVSPQQDCDPPQHSLGTQKKQTEGMDVADPSSEDVSRDRDVFPNDVSFVVPRAMEVEDADCIVEIGYEGSPRVPQCLEASGKYRVRNSTIGTRIGDAWDRAVGFQNDENTCFLAAAHQLLLHAPGPLRYLLDANHLERRATSNACVSPVAPLAGLVEVYERTKECSLDIRVVNELRRQLSALECMRQAMGERFEQLDASEVMRAYFSPYDTLKYPPPTGLQKVKRVSVPKMVQTSYSAGPEVILLDWSVAKPVHRDDSLVIDALDSLEVSISGAVVGWKEPAFDCSNFVVSVAASSGQPIGVVTHPPNVGDNPYTDRPTYTFKSVGHFTSPGLHWIQVPSNDGMSYQGAVTWTLEVSKAVTLYLDFVDGVKWEKTGGLEERGWEKTGIQGTSLRAPRYFKSFARTIGPGIVFKKSFPAGRIVIEDPGAHSLENFLLFVECAESTKALASSAGWTVGVRAGFVYFELLDRDGGPVLLEETQASRMSAKVSFIADKPNYHVRAVLSTNSLGSDYVSIERRVQLYVNGKLARSSRYPQLPLKEGPAPFAVGPDEWLAWGVTSVRATTCRGKMLDQPTLSANVRASSGAEAKEFERLLRSVDGRFDRQLPGEIEGRTLGYYYSVYHINPEGSAYENVESQGEPEIVVTLDFPADVHQKIMEAAIATPYARYSRSKEGLQTFRISDLWPVDSESVDNPDWDRRFVVMDKESGRYTMLETRFFFKASPVIVPANITEAIIGVQRTSWAAEGAKIQNPLQLIVAGEPSTPFVSADIPEAAGVAGRTFEVRGCTVQRGILVGGHWYAYAKVKDEWYMFDDEQATKVEGNPSHVAHKIADDPGACKDAAMLYVARRTDLETDLD